MKNFNSILCVLDPQHDCNSALQRAVTMAANNQSDLTVLGVMDLVTAGIGMPSGGPISKELQSSAIQSYLGKLEEFAAPYRGQVSIQLAIRQGTGFIEIIRQVLDKDHDLVIKCTESRSWWNRLLTSDDMNLLRQCPCPVWLVKQNSAKSCRRILAAVDVKDDYPSGEMESRHALNLKILELSCSLALSEFAELHVVHVWHAIGESAMRGGLLRTPEKKVNEYVESVRERDRKNLDLLLHEVTQKLGKEVMNYTSPKMHIVKGWAREEIPKLATELSTDTLVMGTVGRIGVPGFIMGNTAETILSQINCSVIAIKPPGFKTDVTPEEN